MSISGRYVATIGFFDGVHQGHRYLIRQVMDEAKTRGMKPLVVTFPTHPRKVLHSDYQPNLLTTCDEKVALLKAAGVDDVALMEFTYELSLMTAREFMQKLRDDYSVGVLVIGYDHKFGHNREEGFDDYVRYGKELGIDVVQALKEPEGKYSSTVARNALLEGDIATANTVLGYPYFIEGCVVKGFHVGTKIGYPTANISLPDDKLVPKNGVYQVRVRQFIMHNSQCTIDRPERGESGLKEFNGLSANAGLSEEEFKGLREEDNNPDGYSSLITLHSSLSFGMLNIGHRPTLDNGPQLSIEVHIFDCDEDLYGETLRVEFVKRIRDEVKFESLDDLKAQLARDEDECRKP